MKLVAEQSWVESDVLCLDCHHVFARVAVVAVLLTERSPAMRDLEH